MRGRLFYGWVVVAVAVLATLVAAGVRSVPGALLVPVEQELGWSRTTLSLAVSIGLVLFGLGGPFSGHLVALAADHFGRRNVGTVYGWVFAAHQLGAAFASWAGGSVRDAFGAYTLAFFLAGALAVMAGLLSLGIRQAPRGAGA
ncbi:MAG: hypothetical protein WHT26_09690 [Thermus sp.]|uniref:hypothetical protein n=1 Tax=Thermus sp. TaxID=275 RepID=UPI00309B5E63